MNAIKRYIALAAIAAVSVAALAPAAGAATHREGNIVQTAVAAGSVQDARHARQAGGPRRRALRARGR